MTPFHVTRRIEFHETDMAGIVHFSNFFRYMECAEVEFLRSHGLSVKMTWEGQEIGFPRVSASCDYLKPARFDDVVAIAVSTLRVGQKSVTYSFEFTRDGEVLARGKTTSVCCQVDGDALKAIDIPEGYRSRINAGG